MAISFQDQGKVLWKAVYVLNHHHPPYGTVSPAPRIHGSENMGVEVEMVPFTPSSSLAPLVASCSGDLTLCWPRHLSSGAGMAHTRKHDNDSTELEAKTCNFGLLFESTR